MISTAMSLLMSVQASNQDKVDVGLLLRRRKWLYEATWDREDSGNYDCGEGSPDGAFFKVGESDQLIYCSLQENDEKPSDFVVLMTCWAREGHTVKRKWVIQLHAGKEPVKGTLLRHAAGISVRHSIYTQSESKMIKIDGFHPDRTAPEWNRAQPELEARQVWVHYHYNWHGDAALGNYVDLHGDMDYQYGMEGLNGNGHFVIPKAERDLLR